MNGERERESGKSVQIVRHAADDDNDDGDGNIYTYMNTCKFQIRLKVKNISIMRIYQESIKVYG